MQQEAERKRAFEEDRTIQFRAPANVSHLSTLLGEVLAVHRTYVSDIERASRNPTIIVVERLAKALKVSASSLIE